MQIILTEKILMLTFAQFKHSKQSPIHKPYRKTNITPQIFTFDKGPYLQVDYENQSTRSSRTNRLIVPLIAFVIKVQESQSKQDKEQDKRHIDALHQTTSKDE